MKIVDCGDAQEVLPLRSRIILFRGLYEDVV